MGRLAFAATPTEPHQPLTSMSTQHTVKWYIHTAVSYTYRVLG